MIAELGIFFLILTFVLSSLSVFSPFFAKFSLFNPCQIKISRLTFFCTSLSFLMLTICFVNSDFSLKVVEKNSNSQLPLIYKVTGVWGNHEGSILLWLLVMTFFAFLFSYQKDVESNLRLKTLTIQNFLIFLISTFIIFTSNPFQRSFPPSVDGSDLNPLLQDPGLIFHPPFLYIGYVGFSIVYSISIAILLINSKDKKLFDSLRPWIFFSWTFLTAGIGLGSWWAYYELGWGGFWFWDPVENASLLPWLTASALVHTIILSKNKNNMLNWTILLSIITFLLSLLGTFLVRSGVLISVHAFANDPTRGVFILLLLFIITAFGLFLFLRDSNTFSNNFKINLISKQGAISLNNIFILTLSFTILVGTLYPLFSNIFFNKKISVGAPFFNSILMPFLIPMSIGMIFGPFLKWEKDDILNLLSRLRILFLLFFIFSLIVWYLNFQGPVLAVISLVIASWIITSSLFELTEFINLKLPLFIKSIPLKVFSQTFAHIGIALIIIGATGTSVLKKEKIQFQNINEKINIKDFEVIFLGVNIVEGENYISQTGMFNIYKNKQFVKKLLPEKRKYNTGNQVTTEAAIYSTIFGDLYIAIGDKNTLEKKSWTTRIWFNSFTIWIWIGVLFLVVGGCISVFRSLKT